MVRKKRDDPAGEVARPEPDAVEPFLEDTPTMRAYVGCCGRFAQVLFNLAATMAHRRGTSMITDVDVEDAYRQLTRPSKKTLFSRCFGDVLMIAGGAFCGAGALPFIGVGGLLVVVGWYLREYG